MNKKLVVKSVIMKKWTEMMYIKKRKDGIMSEKKLGRMMSSYYLLQSFVFYVPVLTIFLRSEVNDLFLVSVLLSVKSIATFLFEIPTGFIADHISRKLSIITGTLFYILAMLIFAICPKFELLVIAQLLFGVSETLISGSDQALFYDNFKYINKEAGYQRYYANLTFLSTLALCISFSIGGVVYTYNKRSVFWLTAVFMAASLIFLFSMKEYPYKSEEEKVKFSFSLVFNRAKRLGEESGKFKFYLVFGSGVEAIILSMYLYLVPLLLENSGIGEAYFGFIYAICTILFGVGAKITKYIKNNRNGMIMTLFIAIAVLLVYVWTGSSAGAILVMAGVRLMWGVFDVLLKAQLNSELKNSEIRATMFSISNSITNVGSTLITSAFGLVVTNASFDFLLKLLIGLFGVLVVCMMAWSKFHVQQEKI